VGQYFDSSSNSHGFFRDAAGTITEVIFPGALQTACEGINDSGEITGWYEDASQQFHGFTDIGGTFQANDFIFTGGVSNKGSYVGYYVGPSSTTGCNGATGTTCFSYLATPQTTLSLTTVQAANAMNTSIYGVNNSNVLVGWYTDATNTTHGVMLSGNTTTNIDDPNAANGSTIGVGVNTSGQVVGSYIDAGNQSHGFLYTSGNFTDIGPPAAVSSYAYNITDTGTITGTYYDASNTQHGFVYNGSTYKTIDVPNGTNSLVWGINAGGLMVVDWLDLNGLAQASLYNGSTFTPMNVPGALNTFGHSINSSGNIVYSWLDYYGNYHAAILKSGSFYLFDDPAGTSARADGLNDSNLMVGRFLLNGQYAGFKGTL